METAGIISCAFGLGYIVQSAHSGIPLVLRHYQDHYHSGPSLRSIFRSPRHTSLILFFITLTLWALLETTTFLIVSVSSCRVSSIFVSIFDQLSRILMLSIILHSIKIERSVLVLIVLLRTVLGVVVVGLTRHSFIPVCFPEAEIDVYHGRAAGISQICFDVVVTGVVLVRVWMWWRHAAERFGSRGDRTRIGLILVILAFGGWNIASLAFALRIGSIFVRMAPIIFIIAILLGLLRLFPDALFFLSSGRNAFDDDDGRLARLDSDASETLVRSFSGPGGKHGRTNSSLLRNITGQPIINPGSIDVLSAAEALATHDRPNTGLMETQFPAHAGGLSNISGPVMRENGGFVFGSAASGDCEQPFKSVRTVSLTTANKREEEARRKFHLRNESSSTYQSGRSTAATSPRTISSFASLPTPDGSRSGNPHISTIINPQRNHRRAPSASERDPLSSKTNGAYRVSTNTNTDTNPSTQARFGFSLNAPLPPPLQKSVSTTDQGVMLLLTEIEYENPAPVHSLLSTDAAAKSTGIFAGSSRGVLRRSPSASTSTAAVMKLAEMPHEQPAGGPPVLGGEGELPVMQRKISLKREGVRVLFPRDLSSPEGLERERGKESAAERKLSAVGRATTTVKSTNSDSNPNPGPPPGGPLPLPPSPGGGGTLRGTIGGGLEAVIKDTKQPFSSLTPSPIVRKPVTAPVVEVEVAPPPVVIKDDAPPPIPEKSKKRLSSGNRSTNSASSIPSPSSSSSDYDDVMCETAKAWVASVTPGAQNTSHHSGSGGGGAIPMLVHVPEQDLASKSWMIPPPPSVPMEGNLLRVVRKSGVAFISSPLTEEPEPAAAAAQPEVEVLLPLVYSVYDEDDVASLSDDNTDDESSNATTSDDEGAYLVDPSPLPASASSFSAMADNVVISTDLNLDLEDCIQELADDENGINRPWHFKLGDKIPNFTAREGEGYGEKRRKPPAPLGMVPLRPMYRDWQRTKRELMEVQWAAEAEAQAQIQAEAQAVSRSSSLFPAKSTPNGDERAILAAPAPAQLNVITPSPHHETQTRLTKLMFQTTTKPQIQPLEDPGMRFNQQFATSPGNGHCSSLLRELESEVFQQENAWQGLRKGMRHNRDSILSALSTETAEEVASAGASGSGSMNRVLQRRSLLAKLNSSMERRMSVADAAKKTGTHQRAYLPSPSSVPQFTADDDEKSIMMLHIEPDSDSEELLSPAPTPLPAMSMVQMTTITHPDELELYMIPSGTGTRAEFTLVGGNDLIKGSIITNTIPSSLLNSSQSEPAMLWTGRASPKTSTSDHPYPHLWMGRAVPPSPNTVATVGLRRRRRHYREQSQESIIESSAHLWTKPVPVPKPQRPVGGMLWKDTGVLYNSENVAKKRVTFVVEPRVEAAQWTILPPIQARPLNTQQEAWPSAMLWSDPNLNPNTSTKNPKTYNTPLWPSAQSLILSATILEKVETPVRRRHYIDPATPQKITARVHVQIWSTIIEPQAQLWTRPSPGNSNGLWLTGKGVHVQHTMLWPAARSLDRAATATHRPGDCMTLRVAAQSKLCPISSTPGFQSAPRSTVPGLWMSPPRPPKAQVPTQSLWVHEHKHQKPWSRSDLTTNLNVIRRIDAMDELNNITPDTSGLLSDQGATIVEEGTMIQWTHRPLHTSSMVTISHSVPTPEPEPEPAPAAEVSTVRKNKQPPLTPKPRLGSMAPALWSKRKEVDVTETPPKTKTTTKTPSSLWGKRNNNAMKREHQHFQPIIIEKPRKFYDFTELQRVGGEGLWTLVSVSNNSDESVGVDAGGLWTGAGKNKNDTKHGSSPTPTSSQLEPLPIGANMIEASSPHDTPKLWTTPPSYSSSSTTGTTSSLTPTIMSATIAPTGLWTSASSTAPNIFSPPIAPSRPKPTAVLPAPAMATGSLWTRAQHTAESKSKTKPEPPRLWKSEDTKSLWTRDDETTVTLADLEAAKMVAHEMWSKKREGQSMFAGLSTETVRSKRENKVELANIEEGLWMKKAEANVKKTQVDVADGGLWGGSSIASENPTPAELWTSRSATRPDMYAHLPTAPIERSKKENTTAAPRISSESLWKKQPTVPLSLWTPTIRPTGLWTAPTFTSPTPTPDTLHQIALEQKKSQKMLWARKTARRTTEKQPERTKIAQRPLLPPTTAQVGGSMWHKEGVQVEKGLWRRRVRSKTVAEASLLVPVPLWAKETAKRTTKMVPERGPVKKVVADSAEVLPKATGSLWAPAKKSDDVVKLWTAEEAAAKGKEKPQLWSQAPAIRTAVPKPVEGSSSSPPKQQSMWTPSSPPPPLIEDTSTAPQKQHQRKQSLWTPTPPATPPSPPTVSTPAPLLWSTTTARRTTDATPDRSGPGLRRESIVLGKVGGGLWSPKITPEADVKAEVVDFRLSRDSTSTIDRDEVGDDGDEGDGVMVEIRPARSTKGSIASISSEGTGSGGGLWSMDGGVKV